jgi:hypothetical protein
VFQCPRSRKRALNVTSSVCIFGILRIFNMTGANSADVTFTVDEGIIWSEVEVAVGIVCACIPTYRPLFSATVRRQSRPNTGIYGQKIYSGSLAPRPSTQHDDHIPLSSPSLPSPTYMSWTKISVARMSLERSRQNPRRFAEPIPFGQIKVDSDMYVSTRGR